MKTRQEVLVNCYKMKTIIVCTVFIIIAQLLQIGHCQDFGYDGSEGPKFWGEKYHRCVGKHQSPINIEEHNVEKVHLLPMEFENFDHPPDSGELKNNGHTVVLTLTSTNTGDMVPLISGGPLLGKYRFIQLHFHWGSDDTQGSENKINNNSFPMELHMVFYQNGYGSFLEAIQHPDGLAVLSFLYSNSDDENSKYGPIIDVLPDLQNSNSTRIIHPLPTFNDLIMANRSVYYTYGGSLTTPPCSEVVTWIEFKNTIPLAHKQIEVFRHLKNEYGEIMTHNNRPIQPLYGRLIRMVTDLENSAQKWSSPTTLLAILAIFVHLVQSLQLYEIM